MDPNTQRVRMDQTPASTAPASISPNPSAVNAAAPAPYQQFGNIAQIAPTYANAATVDPASAQKYLDQYTALMGTSLQPAFQQQLQQLQDSLRARGISSSGAAGELEGNLRAQQAAALAGQEAPMVAQGFGYAQQDALTNTGNQQATNMQNAGFGNEAAVYNANAYTGAVNKNFDSYNAFLNELFGAGVTNQNALEGSYLNSFGPQTGVTNAMENAGSNQMGIYGQVYNEVNQAQQQQMSQLGMMLAAGG